MTRPLLLVSTPARRGAEVFAAALAAELAELGQAPTVVALSGTSDPNRLDIEVLGSRRFEIGGLRRLVAMARRHDVVVANGGTTLIPAMLAATAARRPFVYRNIGDPTVWGAIRGADARIGFPLRRAAAIAALYPTAGDELRRRYRLRSDRITVIPNAARPAAFSPTDDAGRRAAQQHLGLDPSRRWVAYVGSLSEEKRPGLAIEAIASDPALGLVMAGDGPLLDTCRAMGAASDGGVRLLGTVTDVAPVYRAVEAVIIPSRTEGIPGVAIEAGMCALPVVASDVGGLSHVVRHDHTGLLVADPDPERLHHAVVAALDRRDELGRAARDLCLAEFSLDTVARQWADLLAGVGRR